MNSTFLKTLARFPVKIEEQGISGELFMDGNFGYNYLSYCFHYDDNYHVAPLILYVKASGKIFRHDLFIYDINNPIIKTAAFKPDYNIKDGIEVVNIRPLISYKPEGPDDKHL